ncbi:MAG: hypothetical protein NVS2B3_09310 [Vulcanimicrobiaceae bacterium]
MDATYRSVSFCCLHRLDDRVLAERVGLRVVAGLVAKPTIFKFSGLPFSGRIGVLAEHWIAEARAGRMGADGRFADLYESLRALPDREREVFVLACVWGYDDATLARALACDETLARERRAVLFDHFEALSSRVARAVHPA